MPIWVIEYRYADTPAVLDEHRPAHRAFLRTLLPETSGDAGPGEGEVRLLGSGPWVGGRPGALLIFTGPDEAAVARALDDDPFQAVGGIAHREIREWTPTIGQWAG